MIKNQLERRDITNKRVLEAMRKVERHLFVKEADIHYAYEDCPLPIGENQTISQPYMVALMTQVMGLMGEEKVLEIGTGSGYQTAILAELAKEVYTIERIGVLIDKAQQCLDKIGYTNIHYKTNDGTIGWIEHSPYDAIIVTAAAPHIPQTLFDQLGVGGKLVVPVGSRFSQELKLVIKKKDNRMEVMDRCGCMFVPLVGKDGWQDER